MNAHSDNLIEISESTVAGLKSYIPSDYDNYSIEQFVINGHLKDIREIKEMPESLKYAESNIFKTYDKYPKAKLIHYTGELESNFIINFFK